MFERVCLVHYHEIGLKGRNRSTFERRLQANLDAALVGLPVNPTQMLTSRLAVFVNEPERAREVADRIALVPGVAGVSVAYKTSRLPEVMERAAALSLAEAGHFESFRVHARRSNTDYTEPSLEMNRRIGEHLRLTSGARVDLTNPDVTVSVTVTHGHAYVSSRRIEGVGGLPVGGAGHVVSLLSAGIDSPVATWRLIRRGAVAVGLHFSGRPATSDMSERLVNEIGRVLEPTGGLGRIYVVAFGDIQREISLASPPGLRVLLYRRLMLRIAEAVARMEGAKALVTGESLGQVASQTLSNVAVVDDAATMPVLRPLIGSDKQEIIRDAKALGTFDISTQSHADCCTLYMPRNPETHARMPEIRAAWDALDIDGMVATAIDAIEWTDFACASYKPPKRWPRCEPPAAEAAS